MKGHLYKIQIEKIEDFKGQAVMEPPLVFTTRNHDDLMSIVEKMKSRPELSAEDATDLAIGLKLFGEVMLRNRELPLFADMQPALGSFIKKLKGRN